MGNVTMGMVLSASSSSAGGRPLPSDELGIVLGSSSSSMDGSGQQPVNGGPLPPPPPLAVVIPKGYHGLGSILGPESLQSVKERLQRRSSGSIMSAGGGGGSSGGRIRQNSVVEGGRSGGPLPWGALEGERGVMRRATSSDLDFGTGGGGISGGSWGRGPASSGHFQRTSSPIPLEGESLDVIQEKTETRIFCADLSGGYPGGSSEVIQECEDEGHEGEEGIRAMYWQQYQMLQGSEAGGHLDGNETQMQRQVKSGDLEHSSSSKLRRLASGDIRDPVRRVLSEEIRDHVPDMPSSNSSASLSRQPSSGSLLSRDLSLRRVEALRARILSEDERSSESRQRGPSTGGGSDGGGLTSGRSTPSGEGSPRGGTDGGSANEGAAYHRRATTSDLHVSQRSPVAVVSNTQTPVNKPQCGSNILPAPQFMFSLCSGDVNVYIRYFPWFVRLDSHKCSSSP